VFPWLLVQARLASPEVAEQRRVWGMAYRQHVLETFQLARHNQQQRQALYIGTLRRQALCLSATGEPGSAAASESGSRAPSVRVPSVGVHAIRDGSRNAIRCGSLLRFASIPEAVLAAQSEMSDAQAVLPADPPQGAETQQQVAPARAQQPVVSPFQSARRPSRLAAASAAAAAVRPPQRTTSDAAAAALALGSATLQHQPSVEAMQSVRHVSGRLGALMRWESERSRVASLPPVWAELARKSSMLSELHVG
jgi:hypothetical protein